MFDISVNVPFTTMLQGPDGVAQPNPALYVNGNFTPITVDSVIQSPVDTRIWSVTFTPTTPGMYALVAFGTLQFRSQCFPKSPYTVWANIEDEALGSWTWNKATGLLTLIRQDGTTMATYDAADTAALASREKLS